MQLLYFVHLVWMWGWREQLCLLDSCHASNKNAESLKLSKELFALLFQGPYAS